MAKCPAAVNRWPRAEGYATTMANQMGKRYTCAECEATVLVTKAGTGELSCHGKAMELAQAKPLPSSD
jgi:hypothetical protein